MKQTRVAIVVLTLGLSGLPARADDGLQFHAFVSQGYLKSSDVNFLANSERGSFEFFEAGLNAQRELTDRLRFGVQLFARDLGPIGNYSAKVDWAYLDYRWRDWLGVRAGRLKLPFGLYNDISDIDAARPTALLPQAVYPAQDRDFLLAQTGLELYGYRPTEHAGAFDYRAYAGTIFLEVGDPQPPGSTLGLLSLTIPYVVGGRLLWETPIEGLRIGGSLQRLRLETELLDTSDPDMPVHVSADVPATLAMGSLEYAVDDFTFAAEYARWYTRVESSDPMRESKATNERAYGMASYRATRRFQPSVYYGMYYPNAGVSDRSSAKSIDVAAALRIDLNPYWILKFEGHHFRGTADLSRALNPGTSPDSLAHNWLLFVAKTTVYF